MYLYLLAGQAKIIDGSANFENKYIEFWAKDDEGARKIVQEEYSYIVKKRLFKII